MTTSEIMRDLDWSRTVISDSVRTLRKVGLSRLNLNSAEKKQVRAAIKEEIAELAKIQPRFKLSQVNAEFKKGSRL